MPATKKVRRSVVECMNSARCIRLFRWLESATAGAVECIGENLDKWPQVVGRDARPLSEIAACVEIASLLMTTALAVLAAIRSNASNNSALILRLIWLPLGWVRKTCCRSIRRQLPWRENDARSRRRYLFRQSR